MPLPRVIPVARRHALADPDPVPASVPLPDPVPLPRWNVLDVVRLPADQGTNGHEFGLVVAIEGDGAIVVAPLTTHRYGPLELSLVAAR